MLTALATAKYPDGSTPEVVDVVRTATFLFGAGQETTAKLLSAALRFLGDRPDIQQQLRDDRSRIPIFIEECLRMDSPVKSVFRMARKSTTLGDTAVPAGTTVMVSPGAANRDPRRFEEPHEFQLDRKNVREHIAFSRGIHSCPGAPLARVEGRVSIERILDRMADITIDDDKHGPAGQRNYTYEPTFILRGLTDLNIKFSPRSRLRSPRSQGVRRPGDARQEQPVGRLCDLAPRLAVVSSSLMPASPATGTIGPHICAVSRRTPAGTSPSPRRRSRWCCRSWPRARRPAGSPARKRA